MTKELDQLEYQDCLVNLASQMEQRGARQILADFEQHYPKHFEEFKVQINRPKMRQIAVLLKRQEKAPGEGTGDAHSM